ncbi:hypothetical protein HYV64_05435 [Candidatus Shapirobacteria bacterium]|nr:hypothetical protein [Candidatus Shapirobacteria bacterium]
MTYTISISSRKLGYFPEELLKKMKIKGKGKVVIFEDNGKWVIKPVKDIMEFAGMTKKKMPKDFDYREYMETHYNESDRF